MQTWPMVKAYRRGFNYKSNLKNMDESKRLLFIQWRRTIREKGKIPLYQL